MQLGGTVFYDSIAPGSGVLHYLEVQGHALTGDIICSSNVRVPRSLDI